MKHKEFEVSHLVHWNKSGITAIVKTLIERSSESLVLLDRDPAFEKNYDSISNKFCAQGSLLRFVLILLGLRSKVMHCHSFTPFLLAKLFCFHKSKFVLHIHNEYPYFYNNDAKSITKRYFLKLLSRGSRTKVVAVSTRAAERFQQFASKKCAVVHNGIADVGTVRESFEQDWDKFRFLSVCRLDTQKDLHYAINLINQLRNELRSTCSYHIYGEGAESASLQALIDEHNLGSSVKLMGYDSQPESLYGKYDYYLSTSDYEGLSLSILAAMRAKLLVVMTKTGELGDQLVEGKEALFLMKDSLADDVSVLGKLMSSSSENKALRQKFAQDRYYKSFSLEKMKYEIKGVYAELADH